MPQHHYQLVHQEKSDEVIDGLQLVFIELPKFKPQTIRDRKMAVLWLRFLTEIDRDTDEIPAELLENPETSKALKILEKSAYSEQELYAYEYYWDAVYNERGAIRHGYKQGHDMGLAEGRAEERRANALKMRADNMPVELIAKYTGLSAEEIAAL